MNQYVLIIMIVALFTSSCSSTKALIAMNKSTKQFVVLEEDTRILHEKGAMENAKKIAKKLDIAMHSVEVKQYKNLLSLSLCMSAIIS